MGGTTGNYNLVWAWSEMKTPAFLACSNTNWRIRRPEAFFSYRWTWHFSCRSIIIHTYIYVCVLLWLWEARYGPYYLHERICWSIKKSWLSKMRLIIKRLHRRQHNADENRISIELLAQNRSEPSMGAPLGDGWSRAWSDSVELSTKKHRIWGLRCARINMSEVRAWFSSCIQPKTFGICIRTQPQHKLVATLPITPELFRWFVLIIIVLEEFGSRAYLQKRLMGALLKTPVESFPPLLSQVLHRTPLTQSRVRTREGSHRVDSTTHYDQVCDTLRDTFMFSNTYVHV